MVDQKLLILKDQGQSSVEFMLSMMLLISLIFFYFQLAIIFAFGNYVHYATFMAARAYLAAGPNDDDQTSRAQAVLKQMLKKGGSGNADQFSSIAVSCPLAEGQEVSGASVGGPETLGQSTTDDTFDWIYGVRYKFGGRFFLIPFPGIKTQSKGLCDPSSMNVVILTSESWLGKEPSTEACLTAFTAHPNWVLDNGC